MGDILESCGHIMEITWKSNLGTTVQPDFTRDPEMLEPELFT